MRMRKKCWYAHCIGCVQAGKSVEMENFFSRLTLDIIGKAVFNYDFDSLTHDDPVIQVGHLKLNAKVSRSAYPPRSFLHGVLKVASLALGRLHMC